MSRRPACSVRAGLKINRAGSERFVVDALSVQAATLEYRLQPVFSPCPFSGSFQPVISI